MNILKRTLKELTNILMSIYQVLFIDSKDRYKVLYEIEESLKLNKA